MCIVISTGNTEDLKYKKTLVSDMAKSVYNYMQPTDDKVIGSTQAANRRYKGMGLFGFILNYSII